MAIDLAELSEGAVMSPRVAKPPPSQRLLALNHTQSVPVYDAVYAARCMRAAAAAAASAAADAAKPKSPPLKGVAVADPALITPRGSKPASPFVSKPFTPASPKIMTLAEAKAASGVHVTVRLVGVGRAGLIDIGIATLALEQLLKSE